MLEINSYSFGWQFIFLLLVYISINKFMEIWQRESMMYSFNIDELMKHVKARCLSQVAMFTSFCWLCAASGLIHKPIAIQVWALTMGHCALLYFVSRRGEK